MYSKTLILSFIFGIVSVGLFYQAGRFSSFSKILRRTLVTEAPLFTMSSASSLNSDTTAGAEPKFPVYFLSHGGPTFMYEDADFGGDKGAFRLTRKLGNYIKNTLKPKAIVVVSAHWQSDSADTIYIGSPGTGGDEGFPQFKKSLGDYEDETKFENEMKLIYDFYGFPDYMYKERFRAQNSPELAQRVKEVLTNDHIKSEIVNRGIDHGVWVPFKVAFPEEDTKHKLNIDIPIVQVSLAGSEDDFDMHFKVGQSLSQLIKEDILIVTSGMSVHNLRDVGRASMSPTPLPYTATFEKGIQKVIEETPAGESMLPAFKKFVSDNKSLYKQAHPTSEHLMPIVVAMGASYALKAQGKQLYTNPSFSLSWGIYQFGKLKESANL